MTFLKVFSRKWILISVLVVAAAGVCVRLGIWQLDRLAQRRVFNARVLAVRAMPALILPTGGDLTMMEYRAVQATGTYDFSNQVAIRDQYNGNQYGYHLLTPLRLSDGEGVLVDRGWIPAEGNSTAAAWLKYDQPGTTSVRGVIRLSQDTPSFAGAANPTPTPGQSRLEFCVYVDIERISTQIPYTILPVYVQLNPDPGRLDPPVPIQPELDLTEGPHQGYAIQWFSFASIMLIAYPFYVRRQENKQ